jgi:hypothetical protein
MRRHGVAKISINSIILSLSVFLFTALFLPATAGAQSTSARLEGIVWDPSGNPTAGVTLTAIEEKTGWKSEAVSDSQGHYVFLSLRPGLYTISANAKGFKEATRRHIPLLISGTATESFTVDVSVIDEEIAPEELVKSDDGSIVGDVSRTDLEALPMLTQDPLSLTVYQPGVQIYPGNEAASTVNGTRQGMNSINMDGLLIGDSVSPRLGLSRVALNPDFIEAFRVVSSNGKAEFGRSAGAHVMIQSRSGGKTWMGSVYDYFGNAAFNANDYFNNASNLKRPNYRQNIFGATASGPVHKKDTFLFANYEGRRIGSQIHRNRLVLNDTAKSGIFQWRTLGVEGIQTYNIVANDPRGLGIDPSIAAILSKLPSPNNDLIGDGLNTGGYSFFNDTHNNRDSISARADHSLNSRHNIFVRFNWGRTNTTDTANNADASFPTEPSGTMEEHDWSFAAGSNWIVNPRMTNEFRIQYLRPTIDYKRPARLAGPMLLANSWNNPLDTSFPSSFKSPSFEISDHLSHSMKRHTLKYGLSLRRNSQGSTDESGIYPNVTFGNDMGNSPTIGPSGNTVITDTDRLTFEKLYNDLLGRIESTSQTYYSNLNTVLPAGTRRERNFTSTEFAAFVQDDFQLRTNLTLNLGLRYELYGVPGEQNGLQRVLNPASSVSPTANISNFTLASGRGWYSKNGTNFAPRLGFAWDIGGQGITMLRGGFGIYYDRLIGAISSFVDTNTYGFSQTASVYPNLGGGDVRVRDGITNPATPSMPTLNLPATRSASMAILDPNLKTPRVYQFNLTVERRVWNSTVVEAGYVGVRGKKLYQNLNYNQLKTTGDFLQAFKQLQEYRDIGTPVPSSNTLMRIFGTPANAFDALGGFYFDAGYLGVVADSLDRGYYDNFAAAGVSNFYLRNFPQFDQFIVGKNAGTSWYNALQTGIRISTTPFHMNVRYTWSKSMDTMSIDGAEFVSPSNSFNPGLDRALSDFDRPHTFTTSLRYMLPIGKSRHFGSEMPRYMDWVLGGWDLGAMYIRESGAPFSVVSGVETLYPGVTSLANYTGDRNIGALNSQWDGLHWFSAEEIALFSVPGAGEKGTTTRNMFRGPRYTNLDLAIYKSIPVRDRGKIQFRIEAYNIFNKARFNPPNTDLSGYKFGIITSTAGDQRALRIALRYEF